MKRWTDHLRTIPQNPARVVLALTGVLALLMAAHLVLRPTPAPVGRLPFAAPTQDTLPEGYPLGGANGGTTFSPDGLTLFPRTHWASLRTLFEHLPNGVPDDAALNLWRGTYRAPTLYQDATQTDLGDLGRCFGACLPRVLAAPAANEDLAITTPDCLTQEQAQQLQTNWAIWPRETKVRVGDSWQDVQASFQVFTVSAGCPVGRWSLRVFDRPTPVAAR